VERGWGLQVMVKVEVLWCHFFFRTVRKSQGSILKQTNNIAFIIKTAISLRILYYCILPLHRLLLYCVVFFSGPCK